MGQRSQPAAQLFDEHSNYVFGRNLDERRRLQYQFDLLREDINLWFDAALRLGGLSTDPDQADWSVLDVGCGEGQLGLEIARRYPHARVLGIDADAAAIAAASAAAEANVRFLLHDARQPIPDGALPGRGFDVVVAWMVLLYLPDRRGALTNLAAALAPGGVLLLGNVPDQPMALDHPSAVAIAAAGRPAMQQLGMIGLEHDLEALLRQVGFADITTAVPRYLIGGPTSSGQRWYALALANISAGKRLVVDLCGLMNGAEYDRHLDLVTNTSALDQTGEARFLVTLARRP
jgi:2-polyprenyl-3-methyl-5-hydroxy-6-metoxy-1,4-benzoquinol methylase